MPRKIPIADAADLAKKRGMAYVIVFGVEQGGQQFAVTSWGKTRPLCKLAGSIADQIADAVLDGKVAPPEREPRDLMDEAKALAGNTVRLLDPMSLGTDDACHPSFRPMLQQARRVLEKISEMERRS